MRRTGRIEVIGPLLGLLAAAVVAALLARSLITTSPRGGAVPFEWIALAGVGIGAGVVLAGIALGLVLALGRRARDRALLASAIGSVLWTAAAAGSFPAGFIASGGRALDSAGAGTALLDYAGGAGLARTTLAVAGAVLAVLLLGIRGRVALLLPASIALLALLLGATIGPRPRAGASASPAEVLTGRPLPPPFDSGRWWSAWITDPVWFAVVAIGLIALLTAVARERRVLPRDLAGVAGLLLLQWVTSGAPHVYGPSLLVAHTVGSVVLATLVPALLVVGAPFRAFAGGGPSIRSQLQRATQGPSDSEGEWGPREWASWARATRVGRALARPIVAGVLFAIVAWGVIAGPALRWAVTDATGAVVAPIALLVAGALLVRALAAPDAALAERAAAAVIALAGIAGIGLSFLAPGLVLADWYGALARPGADPLADQQAAAVVAWIVGAVGVAGIALAARALRRRQR